MAVLIVGSDKSLKKKLKRYFLKEKCDCITTNLLPEAIEHIKNNNIDLIVASRDFALSKTSENRENACKLLLEWLYFSYSKIPVIELVPYYINKVYTAYENLVCAAHYNDLSACDVVVTNNNYGSIARLNSKKHCRTS